MTDEPGPIEKTTDGIAKIMLEGCDVHEVDHKGMEKLSEKIWEKHFKGRRHTCDLAYFVGCLIEQLAIDWDFINDEVLAKIEEERKKHIQ